MYPIKLNIICIQVVKYFPGPKYDTEHEDYWWILRIIGWIRSQDLAPKIFPVVNEVIKPFSTKRSETRFLTNWAQLIFTRFLSTGCKKK